MLRSTKIRLHTDPLNCPTPASGLTVKGWLDGVVERMGWKDGWVEMGRTVATGCGGGERLASDGS